MFCGHDVGIYGGYLGVIAKFGPFCRRDNCSLVRGVWERLITHLSSMVSTCMRVVGVAAVWDSLCCMGGHCAGWKVWGPCVWQEHWNWWKLWKI